MTLDQKNKKKGHIACTNDEASYYYYYFLCEGIN